MVNNRVPTPFVVEALSCLQAMKAGLNLGFRRVVVEGDAFNIIKKVKSNDKDKSILSQYISDIKVLCKNYHRCWFRQICRNRNKIAHAVAQEALKINENTYLEGRLPRAVLKETKTNVGELERRNPRNVNKNKKCLKKEERLVFAKVGKKFSELKGQVR
ncbi:hypothetical protein Gotri_004338, partial [Gossypium trilobum]|nr:hypothetical protein [Gossypium trilobum]